MDLADAQNMIHDEEKKILQAIQASMDRLHGRGLLADNVTVQFEFRPTDNPAVERFVVTDVRIVVEI
jgi:hypothetical protein